MRKAQDDAMARTLAEREIGNALEGEGLIDSNTHEPTAAGNLLLGQFASAVEFERGTGRTPDGQKVAQRRIVITGAWMVDPDATPIP